MVSEEIKNTFIGYLKLNSHRITNERFLILDAALNIKGHFDADELYIQMKNEYMNVSRATVYKTLELMSECSILTKHNFKGDRTRYETKIGRKPHYHMICVTCNKITEFEYPLIEEIQSKICADNNLKTVDHTFQVFVKCEDFMNCENYKRMN